MDKDQLINDFFRNLRATLTNAFSYPKDHPYFIKSVENFKLKLEETLTVLNPLKIGITSSGVVVDGKNLTRVGFYDELARLLHRRKIKNIEIRSGVTLQELVSFFSIISMRQEEVTKSGGVNTLLDKHPLVNFTIEELDYSVFLNKDGQECNDVWGYMLKEALQTKDEAKFNNLADNFGTMIKRANQNDILETQGMPEAINDFLVALKNKDEDKFNRCSKDIFLWLLHNKRSITDEQLAKLKQIFDSLSQEDLSGLFWEGLAQEDNFDALSLQFFSKISEQKDPAQIARGFLSKVGSLERLNNNPRLVKRIQGLLTVTIDDNTSAVYRNTLESLVKGISFSGSLFFDQKTLKDNYRYIVLNILAVDEDEDNLLLASEILEKELSDIVEDDDLELLKDLGGLLEKRRKEDNRVCIDFEKKFSVFIENIILNQPLPAEREFFLEMVSSVDQEANVYLDRIFTGEKADQHILSLFFKFFPGNLDIFYLKVESRLTDIEFILSLIEALIQISGPVTLGILDHIYSSANELIKIEILNNMRKLKKMDTQFLLRQLATPSPVLRKNLLSVLLLDAQAVEGALDLLLKMPNFYGKNNALLIENMQIVFNLGLMEAAGRIHDLSRKKFFWNRRLRAKAKQILKEWDA